MSDLLSIGASGVRAYQNALGTVSENIANSGVAGYARRKTELNEVAAPAATGFSPTKNTRGMGVAVAGVERQVEAYRTAAARSAGADLAKTTAGVEWLDRIEGALTGAQLPARVTGFFNAARRLAADPSSVAPRALMLEAAVGVAGAFAATGASLDRVRDQVDETARDLTDRLDGYGQALAVLNERMNRAAPGSSAAASLGDERDRLLDAMSGVADIDVAFDPAGRATVRLGGSNGPVLVRGAEAGDVGYSRGDTGAASFAVYMAGESTLVSPGGGALGAIADAASRVVDARARLNALATGFTGAVDANQAGGVDLDGELGTAMFATGDDPAAFEVALTDPRGIAAAAVGGGTRDASNLDELERARVVGGYEGALTELVTGNAATLGQRRLVAEAQTAILNGAVAARDAVSGVDLDTEAVDLIRFQQAYQASSRVIQVARETFQSIMDIG